jgi:carbamoyltransferase
LLFSEHHLSHAASAFYPSPFEEAAVLTMDGVGEWATTSLYIGKNNNISLLKEINFPHSIGLLYSAFTYYLGFKVNSGEYKVMGLAPYGEPIYVDIIKKYLIDIKEDGSFKLEMSYFNYCTGLRMTNNKFDNLFGGQARKPESDLTQREMDLAASIQKVTEEIVIKLAKSIEVETKQKNLCLAGGVALNCVANGILLKEKIFEQIWIQPAAGDAGGALGAALSVYHISLGKQRSQSNGKDRMRGAYLGPSYSNKEVKKRLKEIGANYIELNEQEIIHETAHQLTKEKAIGWFMGRMEFGPRALGGRSIIADPRSPEMQKMLNLKVKYRESFRPFAPSILVEHLNEWFEIDSDSPYMLLVTNILNKRRRLMTKREKELFGKEKLNVVRSQVPAITHIDYSARVQTVHRETNPRYYALIKSFYELTGCPIIVNTSFNIRGEPIVCNPEDAFKCFMGTELDILVVENCIMYKENQSESMIEDYKRKYELD